jgi:hypothetical protein
MVARIGYATFALLLVVLAGVFAVRLLRGRPERLPAVAAPAEIAGRPCDEAAGIARELTRERVLDRARLAYLWIVTNCDGAAALPDAMLAGASLLGYLVNQPSEARLVYEDFLRRFPMHADVPQALYHLAKLEIDAGHYAAAVARLTSLADRYPHSAHEQSAKFLASKAAEMLATEQQSRRTLLGQIAELVPNNIVSFLALIAALGPSVIQVVTRARGDAGAPMRLRWVMPTVVVGLTVLNYTLNNIEGARRNRMLMEKLDRLVALSPAAQGAK